MKKIEIMAPAGSFESLAAAVRAGADSVYFGVGKLNMRSRATANFQISDLPKIVRICKRANVKTYLTLNIVVYDEELTYVKEVCDAAKATGVDAVIAADIAVITYADSIKTTGSYFCASQCQQYSKRSFFSRSLPMCLY